ncbi:MAG TPA: ABC transporter ATP-binding protein [Firmicutes bacterium]|nr:ABC transporter ATP-binding protein [Bacillota bacterium]
MFKVIDLRFKYPKSKEDTIKGIEFDFLDGEIFGFLGPSGAGKTTTQKIMIGLLKDYRGEILYKGKDLRSYGREFFHEIGVGFEVPVHFSKLTAVENLDFYGKLYKDHADVEGLLKRVGLWEDRDKKVSEFSKGMKIRLNFVRAMLNNPKMLFLDEPTSGLDPMNARIIKDIILEFQQSGGTVFLTTHLMHDADELCDRVAFIANGEIREIDSPRNLKLRYGRREVSVEYRDQENGLQKEMFDIDTLAENERFFQVLKTKELITIHSGETTLDDIFIKVTGVRLRG